MFSGDPMWGRCQHCDKQFTPARFQIEDHGNGGGVWAIPVICPACMTLRETTQATTRHRDAQPLPVATIVGRSFWSRLCRRILND